VQLNSESERAFNGKNCGPNLSVGDERLSDNVGSVSQFLAHYSVHTRRSAISLSLMMLLLPFPAQARL
jgi:hypothetical protein